MARDIEEEMMDCYQRGRVPRPSAFDFDDPRARADFERMQRGETLNALTGETVSPPLRTVGFEYFRGASQPSHFVTNAALVMAALALILAVVALISATTAHALDHGFSLVVPKTDKMIWAEHTKMPGAEPRTSSCCGKGDMYFADIYQRNPDGSYDAEITDGSAITYPDGTKRIYVPNGTKFHIPAERVNPPSDGNPMGHAVAWLGVGGQYEDEVYIKEGVINNVWCFFPLPEGS